MISLSKAPTAIVGIVFLQRSFCGDDDCLARFIAPPVPLTATDLNGIRIPDACFKDNRTFSSHVFVIGDWGGVQSYPGAVPRPADHRTNKSVSSRDFVAGIDDSAQQQVAGQMRWRAMKQSAPDYFINVGDNFYWAGIQARCGSRPSEHRDPNGQWKAVFEDVYYGAGIDGKQWLGVLGNHDYGGYEFTMGWDQAIGYTWSGLGSGRWCTPSQYWSTRAQYADFVVEYFFVDTNVFDALDPNNPSSQNLCSRQHNDHKASCDKTGPETLWDCPGWFGKLWSDQLLWLDEWLFLSTADWQIVVTHFPPTWGRDVWTYLSRKHGIDLFITGHEHRQEVVYDGPGNFLWPTAWIISGGGGGITAEGPPDKEGFDDMYGFMDLTLSRTEIKIEAISHGGHTRSITKVQPRPPAGHRLDHHEGKNASRNQEEDLLAV